MSKFKVKKGRKFFRGPRWNFLAKRKDQYAARACFWPNCEYTLSKNYDQVNKLTGWSFNFLPWYDNQSKSIKSGHHKNSIRFGWRCIDGEEIEIIAYAYVDKVRKEKPLISVRTDEWLHLGLKETDSYYTLKAISENGDSSIARFKKSGHKIGFLGLFIHRLYPYFGGKISAPHNMTIKIKHLK